MERTRWPKPWLRTSLGHACPSCGSLAGRPILWGMPTSEVFDAIEAGRIDIEIGGCCVSGDDPTHRCRACGKRFGRRSAVGAAPDSAEDT